MQKVIDGIIEYAFSIGGLEFLGLVFGLLAVYFLIKQNILTWITGILYVLISFVIFWQERLYGDLLLHVIFLILNIYGWYYWIAGREKGDEELPVTRMSVKSLAGILIVSVMGVSVFGLFLANIHNIWQELDKAALPYWDSTTSVLSITAMWMTAKKKIENWVIWFIVDILATGIYFYKGIYFYAFLYLIYIGMAVSGYLAWRKSMIVHGSN